MKRNGRPAKWKKTGAWAFSGNSSIWIFDWLAATRFIEKVAALGHVRRMPEQESNQSAARSGETRKTASPCSIVIFGASGDLTARKLIPALYHLFKDKQMPSSFRVVGFARREKTDDSWRQELRTALDQFSRSKPVDDKVWTEFAKNIFYCQGDITEPAAYEKLEKMLSSYGEAPLRENLLFYLATLPSQFGQSRICAQPIDSISA